MKKHFSKTFLVSVPVVAASLAAAFTQSTKLKQDQPILSSGSAFAVAAPPLTLSHIWIVVTNWKELFAHRSFG